MTTSSPTATSPPAHPKKSTNGRTRATPKAPPLWVQALRASFPVAGRLAPPLAATVAESLFFRPPAYRPRPEEDAWLEKGRFEPVYDGTTRLARWVWGEGPRVLLVHGWGGRAGQMTPFVAPLLAAGYRVEAFDGPGHGRSGGTTCSMPKMAEAVEAVAAGAMLDDEPLAGVIGHSMGAGSLVLALSKGLHAHRVTLIAPPSDLGAVLDRFAAALNLPANVQGRIHDRLFARYGVRLTAHTLPDHASALAAPALIVHDEGDREVPFAEGQALAHAWPGARLVRTDGKGHSRILRDEGVIHAAVSHITHAPARAQPQA